MTIRNIISDIRNALKEYSRTNQYTDSFLWAEFTKKRSIYFSRKLKKFEYINPANYQTFCFPLIDSNLNECNLTLDISCYVKRTVSKLPSVITGRNAIAMKVMNVFNTNISKTEVNELDTNQYNDIKKNTTKWFIQNRYVYICNNEQIELVKIEALWDDIKDLDSNVTQCSTYLDVDFNIDLESLDIIISLVLEKLLSLKNVVEDNNNDSNSEIR